MSTDFAAAAASISIDEDLYDYVIDKGPVTDFTVGDEGALTSLSSLRIFGLRKGYAEFAGLPGHYVVNTWTGAEPESVQIVQAPLLVHFKDRGVAPAFLLEWRVMNEKLYGLTIATGLKLSNSNPDQDKSWLGVGDIRPVKLSLIDTLEPIANRDGVPLKKNIEQWMEKHSGQHKKSLGLNSLAAHLQWCNFEKFSSNISTVVAVAEAELQAAVKGGGRMTCQKQIDAAITKRLPPLQSMGGLLKQHIELICVPLTHRLLELQLDPETELAELQQLIKAVVGNSDTCAPKIDLLLEWIRKGERFQRLQLGKTASVAIFSPLHRAAIPATAAGEEVEAESPQIARHLEFDSENVAPDATASKEGSTELVAQAIGTEANTKKRQRVPTCIFEFDKAPKKGKGSRCEKLKAAKAAGGDGTRPYNKSGLYSKDPVKAAIAREKANLPPRREKLEGGSSKGI